MPGPTQDFAGFTEECGFLEEAKESHLVIKKKKNRNAPIVHSRFLENHSVSTGKVGRRRRVSIDIEKGWQLSGLLCQAKRPCPWSMQTKIGIL